MKFGHVWFGESTDPKDASHAAARLVSARRRVLRHASVRPRRRHSSRRRSRSRRAPRAPPRTPTPASRSTTPTRREHQVDDDESARRASGDRSPRRQVRLRDAQVNGCTSANQIGTVDATAKIDTSDSPASRQGLPDRAVSGQLATRPRRHHRHRARRGRKRQPRQRGHRERSRDHPHAARHREPTAPTGAVGAIEGIDTIVADIPQSITDTNDPYRRLPPAEDARST